MWKRFKRKIPLTLVLLLSACGLARCAPEPLGEAELEILYRMSPTPPEKPLSVYFMGHSLIGRDMPAMLAQLAGTGHSYESQLGWGAALEAHWEPDIPLKGAEKENDHPRFREAHEAIASGEYNALVLTEMVSIKDSIKYKESWYYLAEWAAKAIAANPDVRIYIYETWHDLDVEEGWLKRIDGDLQRYWEHEIIDRALATGKVDRPIYVIPGGQVMARFVREIETLGQGEGISSRQDLFKDKIHFNSIGAYLMALTHYAVLYGRSPVGLPHELVDANEEPILAPTPRTAQLMQEIVWEVVTGYPRTGVID